MVTALLSLGLGLAFAAITVKYKDLSHVLGFFIQLWFYATPIVYPASKIPEKYQFIFFLNIVNFYLNHIYIMRYIMENVPL